MEEINDVPAVPDTLLRKFGATASSTPAAPAPVAIDVTNMTEEQIDKMEEDGKVRGIVKDGILIPESFKELEKPKPKLILKDTKLNRDLYQKYGVKAFKKDRKINWSQVGDADVIKQVKKRKDKGKNKSREMFLRTLGKAKVAKLIRAVPTTDHKESTKTDLIRYMEKFMLQDDPSYQRKLRKAKKERISKKKEKQTKKEVQVADLKDVAL